MRISQLHYFIAIVENDFNLSTTAQKIHISQPGLSRFIRNFEETEGIELFNRDGVRLKSLTPVGEMLYVEGIELIKRHDTIMNNIRELSSFYGGTIRIGIPPLILSVLFTEVMSQIMTLNPNIKFVLIEKGAFELRKMLLLNEIDIAILLKPNDLNLNIYNEIEIYQDNLTAFMHKNHPLAKKEKLSWNNILAEKLIMFDESFMIHHLLNDKFNALAIHPKHVILSGSWDFFIETVRISNFVTILPQPILKLIKSDMVIDVPIESPIPWKVAVYYPKKSNSSTLERYVLNSFTDYFLHDQKILPIDEKMNQA